MALGHSVDALVQARYPDASDTYIRLYGGWYDDRGLSRDGTRLTQEIAVAFPITLKSAIGKMRYIHCEIASSLVESRSDQLFSTLRDRHGLDWYIRDPHPTKCVNQSLCSVPIVMKWSRSGCPEVGCPVSSMDAFRCHQQKLVDTLICCDLLSLASDKQSEPVFLISEDDDLVPAMLLAGVRGANVWHVRSKPGKIRIYDALLTGRHVQTTSL